MRAVGIEAPGGVEVLSVIDRPVRVAATGEVRIRVRAAAVNPTDIGLRMAGAGPELAPPWTPGMDAAGTVESLGEGAQRLRVGEQVMAALTPRRPEGGAQAELIVLPEASVVPIPSGATLEQAATLPMNGLTALFGLELLGLHEGQTLAVTGAAGLLGSYVIQIAKRRGLHVIADAKPEDEALVASFGPDLLVARGDAYVDAVRVAAPGGVDGLYDTALLNGAALGAVRDSGTMVVVRGWQPARPERGIAVRPVRVFERLTRTDWLEQLRELASDGTLTLRVAATYSPEQVAEAQLAMEAGGLRGRAVIVF